MVLSKKYNCLLLFMWLAVLPAVSLRAQHAVMPLDTFVPAKQINSFPDSLRQSNATGGQVDTGYLQEKVVPHTVDTTVWRKATKGLDYSPEGKKKKKDEQKIDTSSPFPEISGELIKYISFGVIFLLLGFLIIYLLRSSLFLKNTKVKKSGVTLLQDLEENLQESDLDKALREALEQQDYRLALRIYYLAILKEMSAKQWIKYKRDKTNYEYVRELGMRPSTPIFRDITYTFERFWYGDAAIGEAEYKELSPMFSQFIDQIKRGEHG